MNITDTTPIRAEMEYGDAIECTWGEFARDNGDDAEFVGHILAQIEEHGEAIAGGGAIPALRVYPITKRADAMSDR